MAFTSEEETRIQAIEQKLNELQTAANKMITLDQMNQLLLLRQQEVKILDERITSLESQVLVLQEND